VLELEPYLDAMLGMSGLVLVLGMHLVTLLGIFLEHMSYLVLV
jgi:hypothetical protein